MSRQTASKTARKPKAAKKTPSLVWESKPASTRGPKPAFTTNQVAQAAVRIADTESLQSVTMQRLARDLGVTTMALYRYFPGKAELLAVMIETAGGPAPSLGKKLSSWQDGLRHWARCCLSIYRDHPWFLEATTIRRTPMGPGELLWLESALAALAEAGLSPKRRYYAFLTVIGLIRGHATFEQISRVSGTSRDRVREFNHQLRSRQNQYPEFQRLLDSGAISGDSGPSFEFGLTCILNGITATKSNT